VRSQRVKHAAEDLDVSCILELLKQLVKAGLHDVARDHVQLEQFDDQLHITKHLVLLAHFKLVLVEDKEHMLVEVLTQIILQHGLLHGRAPLTPISLLPLQHLVELLLAPVEKKFSEIHLSVVCIIKLLEEAHA